MKALITGASSGIGEQMAYVLSDMGYDIILAARREERLKDVASKIKTNAKIVVCDLSDRESCVKLHDELKDENIAILINNAGFGVFGPFSDTALERELSMLDTNICALHILMKLFLADFKKRGGGYILNVASSAAFGPGPLLSSYYASKAYVLRLTEAVWREMREEKSAVHVCALCPGPVKTEFDSVAGVRFSLKGLDAAYVAKYAIDKMFKRKVVIVPGTAMKFARIAMKLVPEVFLTRFAYHFQKKKAEK